MAEIVKIEFSERRESVLFGMEKEILSRVGIRFKKDNPIYYEDKRIESVEDPENIKQDYSPIIFFDIDFENYEKLIDIKADESILSIAIDDIIRRDRKQIANWDLKNVPAEFPIDLKDSKLNYSGLDGFNIIVSIHRKKNMEPSVKGWHKSHNISRKIFTLKVIQDTDLFDIQWITFDGSQKNGLFYIDFESLEVNVKKPLECLRVYFNTDVRINFINLDRSKSGSLVARTLSQQIISDIFFFTLKYADTTSEPDKDSLQDVVSKKFKDENYDFKIQAELSQDTDGSEDHEIKKICNIISQRIMGINKNILKFQPQY